MANFPTSLDSFTDKVDTVDDVAAADINGVFDAIEKIEAKVGIDGSVTTTSHDYKLANILHSSGSTLGKFDGSAGAVVTSSNTFEDVDTGLGSLSLLFIEVYIASIGAFGAFKPKGRSGTGTQHGSSSGATQDGCCHINLSQTAYPYAYVTVLTNSSGVFQFAASNTSTLWTFTLLGYIKAG